MPHTQSAGRGALVSVEGLNGVGKTYITNRIASAAPPDEVPLVVEEFSRRNTGHDLGRKLLRTLVTVSDGEPFLRGGSPKSETLLLLAVKMHDFETTRATLLAGRTVIEGRSLHSVAVYQSLILNPNDDHAAATQAHTILDHAARWRPLPDLTVLITDDTTTAVQRAERRDGVSYTAEQWRLHRRAATLFEHLASADRDHVRLIDRRLHDPDRTVAAIRNWIAAAPRRGWPTQLTGERGR